MYIFWRWIIPAFLFVTMMGLPVKVGIEQSNDTIYQPNCRLGIGSPMRSFNYDIASLGVGGYLDWSYDSKPLLPAGVDYIRMFRVGDIDNRFERAKADLDKIVNANPGTYYIIGNEPDTVYEGQDGVTPEVYAQRFYDLAMDIRKLDPTAKIGFGTIVQPTPLRLRYLDRAWKKLIEIAGSQTAASRLINFWAIHSFIMNEMPGEWGVGVPPGFENDYSDAVKITNIDDTHSIDIFRKRVESFRIWLQGKGERNKPLWISEYGSLMPPIDPPVGPDFVNVSDEDTRDYMLATFNFLNSARDAETGLPTDNFHLVQRWFWYSLDDFRYKFGGSLFDPLDKKRTIIGDAYVDFAAKYEAGTDLYIMGTLINPINYVNDSTPTDYRIDFIIANGGSAPGNRTSISIYKGDTQGTPLVMTQFGPIAGCGESKTVVSVLLKNVVPKTSGWFSAKIATTGDVDTSNNYSWFFVYQQP